MSETLLSIAGFALPPFLGAVIGYVTNTIAIRMLFRPLTEKRIFGVRVPLTPGIIPRQRYQLSESIARMVSTKLLTAETVEARLSTAEFEASLLAGITRVTGDLLEATRSAEPAPAQSFADELAELLGSVAGGFVRSDRFRELADDLIPRATTAVGELTVDRLRPSRERLTDLIHGALDGISRGANRDAVLAAVRRWAQSHQGSNTPLSALVGEVPREELARALGKAYRPLLSFLARWLEREEVRGELARRGRDLIKTILKRLNLFQRLLVSAAQYDRVLNDKMPLIVDDIISSIRDAGNDPSNRERIVAAACDRMSELTRSGVGDLARRFRVDAGDIAERVVGALLDLIGRTDTRDRVAAAVWSFLDARSGKTIGQVMDEGFSLPKARLDEVMVEAACGWATREESAAQVESVVSTFVRKRLTSPRAGGSLLSLAAEQKQRLDSFLARQAGQIIRARVPALVEGLNVHQMVVQKIDGLDIESVEQLLLMVIAKHLKWINLFGAVLGAMIGGVQVLLNVLT